MTDVLARVLDSADAGVGGGSAAALAGAMAAGLAGLVTRLSPGRGYDLPDARYEELLAESEALCRELADGARADAEAYGLVAGAYHLPKADAAAAAARKAAVHDALIAAAEVPLGNARRALRVREICAEVEGRSNAAAASDLAAAAMLADVAVRAALLNVEVNTSALSASPEATRLAGEAEAVRAAHVRACAPKEPA